MEEEKRRRRRAAERYERESVYPRGGSQLGEEEKRFTCEFINLPLLHSFVYVWSRLLNRYCR